MIGKTIKYQKSYIGDTIEGVILDKYTGIEKANSEFPSGHGVQSLALLLYPVIFI